MTMKCVVEKSYMICTIVVPFTVLQCVNKDIIK